MNRLFFTTNTNMKAPTLPPLLTESAKDFLSERERLDGLRIESIINAPLTSLNLHQKYSLLKDAALAVQSRAIAMAGRIDELEKLLRATELKRAAIL